MPLEIQVLVPLMHVVVAVAPRRHADRLQVGAGVGLGQRQPAAHLAARELAAASGGFCGSVPNFSMASASIRCELKMPVIAIHTAEMRMTISA